MSAIRQTLYYGGGMILMKGISFVMMPIVTRYLAVAEYGRLDVLVTLLNLGSIVLGFGLVDAMYRFSGLASDQTLKKQIAATAAGLCALLGLAVGAGLYLARDLILQVLPGGLTELELSLALATLAISTTVTVPLAWLRMREQAGLFFLMTGGKAILQALLTLILLHQGWGLMAVLSAGLLSTTLMALALLLWHRQDSGLQVTGEHGRPLLVYGMPMVAGGMCLFLTNGAERWMLAGFLGESELGTYAIAAQFALIATFVLEPYTLWWFPKRFAVLNQADGLVQNARYASLGAVASLVAAMVLAGASPVIINVLLPSSYHAAIPLVGGLTLAIAIKQCSHLMNVGCYSGRSTRTATLINASVAALALVLYPTLIWAQGLIGAVLAALMLYTVRWGLFLWASQKVIYLAYPWKVLSQTFVLTLTVVLASYWLNSALSLLGVTAGALLAVGAIVLRSGLLNLGNTMVSTALSRA